MKRTPEPKYGKRPDGTLYINPLWTPPPYVDPREGAWQTPGCCCLLFQYRDYNNPGPLTHIHTED